MSLPVLTSSQMRDWEKLTWASGRTESDVIGRVGCAVAKTALRLTRHGDTFLVLAGGGNNGADALAAIDGLAGRSVNILKVADPAADLPRLEALLSPPPALIIDGLFGIGLNRPLSAGWVRFIDRLNQASLPVLSVDLPSGLDADSGQPQPVAVKASFTLTVGAPKLGLLRQAAAPFVGRLEVASDVGFDEPPADAELQWTLASDFAGFPPPRGVDSHKGTFGHLSILAGSLGYHGAAVLAARGAQRAQPGLITLHTSPEAYIPIASQLQAVMVRPWTSTASVEAGCSAILVGPGLAAPEATDAMKTRVRDLWLRSPRPMIADASALDWIPPEPSPASAVRVVTPHPGEAARMLSSTAAAIQSDRSEALRRLSARFGNCWVVLKGHHTLIGRGVGPIWVNSSGNPYLAQGGSGDVLSGYIAGFLAQPGLPAALSLRYAVWHHGTAADRLATTCAAWTIEELAAELRRPTL